MKAIFSKLSIDDSPRNSPEGSGTTFNDFGLAGEMSSTPRMAVQDIFARIHPAEANSGFSGIRPDDTGLGLDGMSQPFVDGQGTNIWVEPTDPSSAINWSTQTGFYQPPRQ